MQHRLATLFICIILNNTAIAQSNVSPKNYDFGDLTEGSLLYTDFKIVNAGSKTDYVLRADVSQNMKVIFSDRKIPAGATVFMRVHYAAPQKGLFDEKIRLYVGSNNSAYELTVKGNVLFTPTGNELACPPFGSEEGLTLEFKASVIILDSITEKPIKQADVSLIVPESGMLQGKSNAQGKVEWPLTPGRYLVTAVAEGYKENTAFHYFNRHNTTARVLLSRTSEIAFAEPLEEVSPEENTRNKLPVVTAESDKGQLAIGEYASNNIVFLVDISTSMRKSERLDLLKEAMVHLLQPMRSIDRLAIITYASDANILMNSRPVIRHSEIETLIRSLEAAGSTEGGKGLKKAYQVASENFIEGGNNQVIIATDGAFSENPDNKSILNLVKRNAGKGILLSVVGIKNPQWTVKGLQGMAHRGKGSYIVIDSWEEGNSKLLDEIKLRSRKK